MTLLTYREAPDPEAEVAVARRRRTTQIASGPDKVFNVAMWAGAYALGSTRWGVVRMVVLPFGRGGVVGGTVLGL